MTTVLARYKRVQMQIEQKEAEVKALEQSEQVQRILEFEALVKEIMAEYEVEIDQLVDLLCPGATITTVVKPKTKVRRSLKVYTNPHSGEVAKTRGRSKVVSRWKERYGDEEVERWMEIES